MSADRKKGYCVAVAGATGAIGREMIAILGQRNFPVARLLPLASAAKPGRTLEFAGDKIDVLPLAECDFAQVDLALFSAGSERSQRFAPVAAAAGAIVIDNSSCFRRDPDVPLVVSEVNPQALASRPPRGIIANPNCSTMQMMVALKPLHEAAGIRRIVVSTYQAVSGAGSLGVDELAAGSGRMLNGQEAENNVFPDRIAFNVIPHIDTFQDNGFTREEMKMVWETRRILEDDSIAVAATAVRVPVFYGHSEAVYIETERHLAAAAARSLLEKAAGVKVIDQPVAGGYPTPLANAAGADEVFVGRIRADLDAANGLHLWVVSDNVRKGGALNAVQLAEIALKHNLWRQ